MTNYLILHGTDSTPQSNWFMWLKGKLVGKGNKVWLPQLPKANMPNAKTYTKFIRANKDFVFDKDTVLIGHSSGAVEILYLLQKLPTKTVIKAAVLVGAFKDDLGWKSLSELFQDELDFDKIKQHCLNFTYLHSDDDPHCPLSGAEYLMEKTGGDLITFEGQGHFNTELSPSYKQFPELLEIIEGLK